MSHLSALAELPQWVGCGNEARASNRTLGVMPGSGRREGLFGVGGGGCCPRMWTSAVRTYAGGEGHTLISILALQPASALRNECAFILESKGGIGASQAPS